MLDLIGKTVVDVITDFEGVVTGVCYYISGCNQALVQPRGLNEKGEVKESRWLDVQRLSIVPEIETVVLDNSATPGFDREAPKR